MLRMLLVILVVLSLVVFLRLIILRIRQGAPRRAGNAFPLLFQPPVLEEPMVIRSLLFDTFDAVAGPSDPSRLMERMQVRVGPASGSASREVTFEFLVATPDGLADAMRGKPFRHRFGRGLLLVERYDLAMIQSALQSRLRELDSLAEEAPY